MRKSIRFVLSVFLCLSNILWYSCNKEIENEDKQSETGNIYGVVTVKSTAEPMRGTGVELLMNEYLMSEKWVLLEKTVTYDDGHFEFNDLPVWDDLHNKESEYKIAVEATGYKKVENGVRVLPGHTSRIDIMLEEY